MFCAEINWNWRCNCMIIIYFDLLADETDIFHQWPSLEFCQSLSHKGVLSTLRYVDWIWSYEWNYHTMTAMYTHSPCNITEFYILTNCKIYTYVCTQCMLQSQHHSIGQYSTAYYLPSWFVLIMNIAELLLTWR